MIQRHVWRWPLDESSGSSRLRLRRGTEVPRENQLTQSNEDTNMWKGLKQQDTVGRQRTSLLRMSVDMDRAGISRLQRRREPAPRSALSSQLEPRPDSTTIGWLSYTAQKVQVAASGRVNITLTPGLKRHL